MALCHFSVQNYGLFSYLPNNWLLFLYFKFHETKALPKLDWDNFLVEWSF